MPNWKAPQRPARSKRRRIITLSAGILLLGVTAPELGILPWTPVRGDTNPAVDLVGTPGTQASSSFATPWIVPDPPPLVSSREIAPTAARISIKASNISWVTVCADGRKVFERLFEAGTAAEIPFSRQVTLRSGNAGALEIEVAGHAVGPMGPWGAIRMIRATPEGYQFVAPVIASGCAAS